MYTPWKELTSKCCYCATPRGYQGFQKFIEMEDAGITLYCNAPATDDVTLLSSSPCIVILLKMKDKKAKAEKALPKLDIDRIPCPRCKRIAKHAQELLHNATGTDSNIIGICDHCRMKIESHESCSQCEKAIKMFLLAYGMEKKDAREFIRIWLSGKKDESKIKDFKDFSRYNLCRSYSDGDLDESKGRQLQAEPMFHSQERIPGTDILQMEQQERKEGKFKDLEDASEDQLKDASYKTDSEEKKMLFDQATDKGDELGEQIDIDVDEKGLRKFTEKNEEDIIRMDAMKFEQKSKQMDEKPLDSEAKKAQDRLLQEKGDQLKQKPSEVDEQREDVADIKAQGVKAKKDKDMDFENIAPKSVPESKMLGDNKEKIKGKDQGLDSVAEKNVNQLTKKKDEELKKQKQLEVDEQRVKDMPNQKERELKTKMGAEKDGGKTEPKSKSLDKKSHPNQQMNAPKSAVADKASDDKKDTTKGKNKGLDSVAEKNLNQLSKTKDEELKKQKQLEVDEKRVKDLANQKERELKTKMGAEKDGGKTDPKSKSLDKKSHPDQQMNATKSAMSDKASEDKKDPTKGKGKELDSVAEKNLNQVTKKKDEELKKQKQLEVDEQRVKDLVNQKERELKTKMGAEKDGGKTDPKSKSLDKKSNPDQQMNATKSATSNKASEDRKDTTKGKNKGLDSVAEKNLNQLNKEKDDELKKQKQLEVDEKRVKELADQKERESKAKMDAGKAGIKGDHKPKSLDKKLDSTKDSINEEAAKAIAEEEKRKKEKLNNDFKDFEFMKMQAQAEREKREAVRKQEELEKEQAKAKELAQKMLEQMKAKQQEELVPPSPETVSEKRSRSSSTIIAISESHKCKPKENKIITGENVSLYRPPIKSKPEYGERKRNVPLLFENNLKVSPMHSPKAVEITADYIEEKKGKGDAADKNKGITRYALSDRTFIEKGWTMLPTEKVVRKMNVYRMRPARPEFDWFERNKSKPLMTYDSGEKLAEIDDNGRGRWYYRNGRLALDYYDAEEVNAQQRFVVYSSGEPDERGRTHPITILATFDYLGNGIVFDHAGKIRLKYNQTEGVVLDRGIGPVTHWKWHTLNDPPVLQQVMMDTQIPHKDPTILQMVDDKKGKPANEGNQDMIAIEFDNFIKEKKQKLTQNFKPFQIKMKALKINQHFSLRVLDQATVYLLFRDGSTTLKLNIGMVLDHREIVDTDTAEVGEVANSLERFPARTDSLAGLQRSIACAQHYERSLTERERRTRPTIACASVDKLVAPASRPMRRPLRTVPTVPSGSTSSANFCKCSRKPSLNLYYDTRHM